MKHVKKLMDIGTPSLGDFLSRYEAKELCADLNISPLTELYAMKNGIFAFEHALHIFPITPADQGYTLQQWNAKDGWRRRYRGIEDVIFYAENIFGEPFGLKGESVVWLDVETGRIKTKAESVEEWAGLILKKYRLETGYPVAHVWQILNYILPTKERLLPKKLFCLGGLYEPDNFYALDAIEGMEFRGQVYEQIRDLPPGSAIEFVFKNKPD